MSRRRTELSFSLFAFQDIITAVTGILLLITITLAIVLITTVEAVPIEDRKDYHVALQKQVESLQEQAQVVRQDLDQLRSRSNGLSRVEQDRRRRELNLTVSNLQAANSAIAELEQQQEILGAAWSEQKSRDDKLASRLKANNDELLDEINHIRQKLQEWRTSKRFFFNPPEGFNRRPWLIEISSESIDVAPADGDVATKSYPSARSFLSDLSNYSSASEYFVLFVHPSGISQFERIQSELDERGYQFGMDAVSEEFEIVP